MPSPCLNAICERSDAGTCDDGDVGAVVRLLVWGSTAMVSLAIDEINELCDGGNDAGMERCGLLLVLCDEKYLTPTSSLSVSTAAKYCKTPNRCLNSSSLNSVTNYTHENAYIDEYVHTYKHTYRYIEGQIYMISFE